MEKIIQYNDSQRVHIENVLLKIQNNRLNIEILKQKEVELNGLLVNTISPIVNLKEKYILKSINQSQMNIIIDILDDPTKSEALT